MKLWFTHLVMSLKQYSPCDVALRRHHYPLNFNMFLDLQTDTNPYFSFAALILNYIVFSVTNICE